ncbi:ATP-binding protein [Actinomadura luteofluorescens]|uniref:AlbA family DNA-binding domain-containing protein n=1 Tax=Actinomadura luteofluorescens TaxID=46163 RepID=UPI0030CF01CA
MGTEELALKQVHPLHQLLLSLREAKQMSEAPKKAYKMPFGGSSINGWDVDVPESRIHDVRLSELAEAMAKLVEKRGHKSSESYESVGIEITGGSVTIKMDRADSLDNPWESPWVYLEFTPDGQVLLTISVFTMRELTGDDLEELIIAHARQENVELHQITPYDDLAMRIDHKSGEAYTKRFEIHFLADTGKIGEVGSLLRLARTVCQEAYFYGTDLRSPRVTQKILELGQASRLIGQAETDWLEVKSPPYEMKRIENRWKWELASDVARFANAERGGILIIGILSKKIDGKDTLVKLTPVPRSDSRITSYMETIDRRVHPPISGLKVDEVAADKGVIVYILVPPQVEESKPFMVQGAFFDEKYQESAIFIPRRRGEHSIPATAREIQTLLAAGRAYLRSGGMATKRQKPDN